MECIDVVNLTHNLHVTLTCNRNSPSLLDVHVPLLLGMLAEYLVILYKFRVTNQF